MTGQIIELHTVKCIENIRGKIRLGMCNNDQRRRNQKWKFVFHNTILINSADTPWLTAPVILQWHRNFSIHDMPFPPLPTIIQHPDTTIMPIAEPTISPGLPPELPDQISLVEEVLINTNTVVKPDSTTLPTTTSTTTTTPTTTTTSPTTKTTTAPKQLHHQHKKQ